jgi:fructokinase
MQVLSIGEILWDIFPEKELLGGAALNFSANIGRLGDAAALITAVGEDARGRAAREAMERLGLTTQFLQVVPELPTGYARVGTTSAGEPSFEIPRPAAFDRISLTSEMRDSAVRLRPDWLYFGTLLQIEPALEKTTAELASTLPGVRCFYDMNLRTGQWNLPLVQRLCRLASVVKLNESEARTLEDLSGIQADAFFLQSFSLESFCQLWSTEYRIDSICITLGGSGCFLYDRGSTYIVPGYPVTVEDTVGAGDAFAAAFLHCYHRKWPILRTARLANALGSIVAGRVGATPAWSVEECLAIASISPEEATSLKDATSD